MDIEEMFFHLCEEVARLQDLCSKQGKLLQKLTARRGPILDLPVSLPIQCTEGMAPGEGGRQQDGHQKCSEALAASASATEGSAHPLAQPQAASTLPTFSTFVSGAASDPICSNGSGGVALAMALGSSKAERRDKVDVETWLKSCQMLPTMQKEGVRACCSPQELVAPNPGAGDSFLTLLDLYEAPETLQGEDVPSQSALLAEAKVPVEIRGPGKPSWTPRWVLEDGTLGQGTVLTSEDAQVCDICQEIFPLDAGGQEDYLKHILTHMK
ncbi:uncharacterized protein LOC133627876 [Colius striatus]|uniref:uncharacterized protein LOC133627876 n=1 Tax=Colius striatus TaxID=57412 RepID=UPI002B1E3971|nr:uncharacterized protein LOC133627876 [Colius striatus]